jgi:hypothetical protein
MSILVDPGRFCAGSARQLFEIPLVYVHEYWRSVLLASPIVGLTDEYCWLN